MNYERLALRVSCNTSVIFTASFTIHNTCYVVGIIVEGDRERRINERMGKKKESDDEKIKWTSRFDWPNMGEDVSGIRQFSWKRENKRDITGVSFLNYDLLCRESPFNFLGTSATRDFHIYLEKKKSNFLLISFFFSKDIRSASRTKLNFYQTRFTLMCSGILEKVTSLRIISSFPTPRNNTFQ